MQLPVFQVADLVVYLLLIIAIGCGWLLGRFQGKRSAGLRMGRDTLPSIDFLLAENNDGALDRLLDVAEISDEAVELYLNLGRIFREKGQTEKSIQLHQNLFARTDLSDKAQLEVELELATDFLKAGLLDRAERLLTDLIQEEGHARKQASRLLVQLYEEEQEWQSILDLYKNSKLPDMPDISSRVAQAACEYADGLFAKGDYLESHQYLKLALKVNPLCARANVIFAQVAASQGEPREAIRCYLKALKQDNNVMLAVLPGMAECFINLDDMSGLDKQLANHWQHNHAIEVLVKRVKLLAQQGKQQQAIEILLTELFQHPSNQGFFALVEMVVNQKAVLNSSQLMSVYDILRRIVETESKYICRSCGFKAIEHHWRCPSCKSWASVTAAN
jgi:lipopolysaccharide biosynthesis regulator YciM